jgi:O-antigen/teichoic acid export membrane protein
MARSRIARLASETAIYGLSSVVGRLINFLLFPFYSQVFPPDVFRPVVILYAAFIFFNIVYQHGMESAYLKFGTERKETAGRSHAFGTAMLSVVLVTLAFSTIIWLLPEVATSIVQLDPRYGHLMVLGGWILFFDALSFVPFADLRLQGRAWVFAAIRLANIAVNVGLNLWLILGLKWGIEAVLWANLVASGSTFLLLLPVIVRRLGTPDKTLWRKLLRFGLPFVPGGIGYAITERINLFFLEQMKPERAIELYDLTPASHPELAERAARLGDDIFTGHVVGVYGGIIKLAVLMALFVQMFRYAWQPFFLQRQEDEDAPALFGRIFRLLTLILLAAFLGISFLANELVAIPLPGGRTLIAEPYWLGLFVIPIALLGYVFQGWYYHFSAGAYISGLSKYFMHATLFGSAVALLLNATIVPYFGMWAAAVATSAAYAVMAFSLLWLIQGHYPVPYAWRQVILTSALAGGLFAAWSFLAFLQIWYVEVALTAGFFVAGARILDLSLTSLRDAD